MMMRRDPLNPLLLSRAIAIGSAMTLLSGCLACEDASRFEFGDGGRPDTGVETLDAAPDAGPDAGPDAAVDAGRDSGPTEEVCDGLDNDLDDLLDEGCAEVAWEVAPRTSHVCVRTNRGRVLCAGDGSTGLLGDGERHVRGGLEEIAQAGPFVSLASGRTHACAVHLDGQVYCWGEGNRGQNGSLSQRLAPGLVADLDDALSVTAGATHTCAVRASGEVACWGANGASQLGDSVLSTSAQPVDVTVRAATLASGNNFNCAISAESSVVECWGGNGTRQAHPGSMMNLPTPQAVLIDSEPLVAQAVASGAAHTCASRAGDGRVFCWGHTPLNRLGGGGDQPVRTQVESATHLVAGAEHTCAIRDAQVVCWGSNRQGQLGPNLAVASSADPITMTFDEAAPGTTPVALFAGEASTCARFSDGAMYCWGWNSHGQLARNTTLVHPTPMRVLTDVSAASLGAEFTCAVRDDGAVRCAGSNALGQLGDALDAVGGSGDFVLVDSMAGDVIAAGPEHACLAQTQLPAPDLNTVACWGSGADERLGVAGGSGVQSTPVVVDDLIGATGITLGLRHGCMARDEGALCFGNNDDERLGRGGAVGDATPQPVEGPLSTLPILQMGAGLAHTCALAGDVSAKIYCWGRDVEGQISGAVSGTLESIPLEITRNSAPDVRRLTVGANHNCVVIEGPSPNVICWGNNSRGQLGVPGGSVSYEDANPLAGGGDNPIVAAGVAHTCAADGSNHIACWGEGGAGQTGRGDRADSHVPTTLTLDAEATVEALSLGQTHSCALVRTRSVNMNLDLYCWGADLAGALGRGRELSLPEPALVEMP